MFDDPLQEYEDTRGSLKPLGYVVTQTMEEEEEDADRISPPPRRLSYERNGSEGRSGEERSPFERAL